MPDGRFSVVHVAYGHGLFTGGLVFTMVLKSWVLVIPASGNTAAGTVNADATALAAQSLCA